MGTPRAQVPPREPATGSHRLANLFIVAFVALQVFLPLRYYASDASRQDERFAWRMFSSLGRQTCGVVIHEYQTPLHQVSSTADPSARPDGGEKVKLRRDYQGTWITLLEKMRPLVVEKLLRSRCLHNEAVEFVDYRRKCKTTAGEPLPVDLLRYDCRADSLEAIGEATE